MKKIMVVFLTVFLFGCPGKSGSGKSGLSNAVESITGAGSNPLPVKKTFLIPPVVDCPFVVFVPRIKPVIRNGKNVKHCLRSHQWLNAA